MTTTVQSIIGFLESRASSTALTQPQLSSLITDLRAQINQLSVAVPGAQPGATTPLYNGLVGDGVHTGVVADAIAGALNSDRQYGQDQEEQISMAFVNEYVSEEDIKKYNLEEIWLEYNVIYRKTGVPSHVRLNWTVDHDRCIYLMWIGGAGYDQDFTDWVLYLNGKSINFRLTKPGEGSKSFKEQPYRIVWDLMSIHPELPEPAKREAVQTLKEALTAYGYAGARNQAPGITIVEFKF